MSDEQTVFRAMEQKDPRLFASLSMIPIWEVIPKWKAKYPDDFPMGGRTAVDDLSAIKPVSPPYTPSPE